MEMGRQRAEPPPCQKSPCQPPAEKTQSHGDASALLGAQPAAGSGVLITEHVANGNTLE